jgi:hypothetical protein
MVHDNPETFADLDGHCPECVEEIAEEIPAVLEEISPELKQVGEEISAEIAPLDNAITSASNKVGDWIVGGLAAGLAALKGDQAPTKPSANQPSAPTKPSQPADATPLQSSPSPSTEDSSKRHTRDKHQGDHPSRTGDKLRDRESWVPKKKAGDPATPKPQPPPPPPPPPAPPAQTEPKKDN